MKCTQHYFCYCDLNNKKKQLEVLGRKLIPGKKDRLKGFKTIEKAAGPFAIKTTNLKDEIVGILYKISFLDLYILDEYEKAFKTQRIATQLASGKMAWIYVER